MHENIHFLMGELILENRKENRDVMHLCDVNPL